MLDREKSIVSDAVRGEASAFGLLYDYYQSKIYRFIVLKVGRSEEAEDLTHQVFLNAWQNIKNYKSLGFPFSSWLYRIARNLVIDHYRTLKETTSVDQIDPEYFAAPATVHLDIDNKLQIREVRLEISKLEPDYQDVIIMRFVEDLSIKESAEALGKSEGAVKLMQYRALKKLKESLRGKNIF